MLSIKFSSLSQPNGLVNITSIFIVMLFDGYFLETVLIMRILGYVLLFIGHSMLIYYYLMVAEHEHTQYLDWQVYIGA